MPTTPLNFSDSHYRSAETTPGLGEHSRAVLVELGLDPAEIDVLVQRGIIAVE
jgi:crotonobetainyl-CoA:carnitine CoA-transferase CaiB-like acyl-CoA transferase